MRETLEKLAIRYNYIMTNAAQAHKNVPRKKNP